ncbi:hypothetical protein DesfrDRAFT_0186 [Solidesulfovibrio fructosivorans JJ]]|uniref:Uncharacterized protein n=2 Tax=Solidesulfovibrio fructosivorans TaxID=878 RepID=E1JRD7_SOLFR|nr:hypothetical protein DesfrDRAFT_0186 [Solidesulfovibrio fructosivorans JJ]]
MPGMLASCVDLTEIPEEGPDMEGIRALKLHLDAAEAMADAAQAETRLRHLLGRHALVLHPDAQQAARDCLDALDRLDNLGRKARALGV